MPKGAKTTKPVEDVVMEEEAVKTVVEATEVKTPKKSIEALIVKLCDDVTQGRTRDEYKTLGAIADLYNAVKVVTFANQ